MKHLLIPVTFATGDRKAKSMKVGIGNIAKYHKRASREYSY